MARFASINVPFTGFINIEVEVPDDLELDEEMAYDLAMQRVDDIWRSGEDINDYLAEQEFHPRVVEGNRFHGVLNEIDWHEWTEDDGMFIDDEGEEPECPPYEEE